MTKLACLYGVDAVRPEKGIIVEHCDDDQRIDMGAHRGCLYLEVPDLAETWGRFGPAPEMMGAAPSSCYPCHDELDKAGVADNHHLRRVAGLPMPCNRRREDDRRPWAAPDLTPEIARIAKRLEMAAAFDAAAAGGFPSMALDPAKKRVRIYPSDPDAERKLQLAALAALSGQSKPGWTAMLRCAEAGGAMAGVPHTAAQIHEVLADYQSFVDALHGERDAIEVRVVGAPTAVEILAIARA